MRKLPAWSLLGVLVCVSLGSADLVSPRRMGMPEPIRGFGTRSTIERFKANEDATIIVSGEGGTCMGLYVFDAAGNCVAKDDVVRDGTTLYGIDDLSVKWIPANAHPCSVEVRNGGISASEYEIAVR